MGKKRFLFFKTFQIVTLTSSLVLASFSTFRKNTSSIHFSIPYTNEDYIHNLQFSEELEDILKTKEISFKNQELKRIVKRQVKENHTTLEELDTLVIDESLQNIDLSDLKYLPHLKYLAISNNLINLEDIQYNQKLEQIQFNNCYFYHTFALPNTIYAICMDNSTCLDQQMILPYNIARISFRECNYSHLVFKCPKYLEEICIQGNAIFDLSILKDCYRLKKLDLSYCSNVLHPEVLSQFKQDVDLVLDDYAPIWLKGDTLNQLSTSIIWDKKYEEEVYQLDQIANQLTCGENLSDEEKIKRITLYVLDQLEYDKVVLYHQDNGERTRAYDKEPIFYALARKEAVCMNYASLFQALANRLGLQSIQAVDKTHAWNIVKKDKEKDYRGYDLTNLDVTSPGIFLEDGSITFFACSVEEFLESAFKDQLFYYGYDLHDSNYHHVTDRIYLYNALDSQDISMGYIKDYYKVIRVQMGDKVTLFYINRGNVYAFLLAFFGIIVTPFVKKEELAYTMDKLQKTVKKAEIPKKRVLKR